MTQKLRRLILFDVDGTLTVPRQMVTEDVLNVLSQLRAKGFSIGTVGGSDYKKQVEQLGNDVLQRFDYVFSENGLLAFQCGVEFHRQSLVKYLGNEKMKLFVKKALRLIADLDIPVQRGTFIELRNGMFNISPIGRNCSTEERDAFEQYDKEHHVRNEMIKALKEAFPSYNLQYSIGGQISFDVFPVGWDKTYCLQFVENDFDEISFFGDKTHPGGNDFEIFHDPRTKGYHVNSHLDTIRLLQSQFLD